MNASGTTGRTWKVTNSLDEFLKTALECDSIVIPPTVRKEEEKRIERIAALFNVEILYASKMNETK